ncbi:hypothetical protein CGLO_13420 [Colletotrichum gloeosporioides Cg-14]|uniref:Uncharacterized protein n=1 Tax=Colletotrichum gloeosporioides (strain Cg-14) TaxID=1237896 RepID=T0K657_COLGC|nr:hypothetical protein CGLO_13420 [Colletotrichum gloeosporioides Cg-14]
MRSQLLNKANFNFSFLKH